MTFEIIKPFKPKKPLTVRQCVVIATVSFIVGVIIFLAAYISMVQHSGLDLFNQPILSWMINHRSPLVTFFAKIITSLANPRTFILIVGFIVLIWSFIKRESWRPLLFAGSMIGAAITSIVLKNIIMDVRPPQINMIPMFEMDYSFPSGHTIGIAVFLLVIGYLIYSRNFSNKRFWVWMMTTIAGTGLIALSRLYLGYHWLTDVVASIGLGLIILAIVIFIDIVVRKKLE